MKTFIYFLLILGILSCIAWVVIKPGYDSVVALITNITALFLYFVASKKNYLVRNKQNISKNSVGIQGKNISNIKINIQEKI